MQCSDGKNLLRQSASLSWNFELLYTFRSVSETTLVIIIANQVATVFLSGG
jgi:hypothetical protein